MVTDEQYRRLMKLLRTETKLSIAAMKAGMDEKTARKWRDIGTHPSQVITEHTWKTRENPFEDVWPTIEDYLDTNNGLEAKTIFEALQREKPGVFADGQLRTLQRHIKAWRALNGPAKEVMFPQEHTPGKLCQSDFTHMSDLNVTINRTPFSHLIYHFVLTYSNWETGTICFSESFESLSEGLQNALWRLGAVPKAHQTDRLSTAVHKDANPEEFTRRYQGLLNHYGMVGKKIQAREPHENGDIEQRHHRFKRALDQALMLRGSRDFDGRSTYEAFVMKLFTQLNAGRRDRLAEELGVMARLPMLRLDALKRMRVKVGPTSTVRIMGNTYSVHSRLIGEAVEARIYAEHIDIHYAQRVVERLVRLRGKNGFVVNYRHIIDSLVRKPGAFENYRYREALFPTSIFRIAYDLLNGTRPATATKEYLRILHLAARESEEMVARALGRLIDTGVMPTHEAVKMMLDAKTDVMPSGSVNDIELGIYDTLLTSAVV